ncbi:glycosyltransferase [Bacteroides sp.]|uniref:glycosyltransferase n=1 Tax=Bacteroides sp. TaxID=29523 RepID=UPI0023D445F8|nr:glycosyltransferase [Bacteroides sp.]MDE6216420.1 glycosyltransferase [Bacteroides sp.]
MSEVTTKQLTVIISFLNEGIEVARTVESVRQYAAEQVDILVINDASNHLYDYEEMLKPYSVAYIRNEKRIGIAACRDLGVSLIQTPYFLFLDAHMRFYREGWAAQIASYLNEDDRQLLCCQTYALIKDESDEVIPLPDREVSYGAYISFQDDYLLRPKWIFGEKPEPEKELIDIPCVFGAAYAASKRYWMHLRGLEGLIRYGFDETYISLKVWMEGGRCRLIKNIEAGHIYRTRSPYRVCQDELMYNRLWIAALLLPENLKEKVFSICRQQNELLYQRMLEQLEDNQCLLEELNEHYKRIFTIDFDRAMRLSNNFNTKSL